MASDGFVYDAFISYSRRNLAAADQIERDLQKFALTRDIRNRLGRRHLNIFRDINDLTGNRLAPALEENLRQSRTLVVLCSPAARASTYVGMEIARFAELRDADHIVPVLVAGVPNNDAGTDPADWAFPDALNDALGGLPLAPDLRQDGAIKRPKGRLTEGSPWTSSSPASSASGPTTSRNALPKPNGAGCDTFRRPCGDPGRRQHNGRVRLDSAQQRCRTVTHRHHAPDRGHRSNEGATQICSPRFCWLTPPTRPVRSLRRSRLCTTLSPRPRNWSEFYDFGEPVTMVDGRLRTRGCSYGGTESGTVCFRLDRFPNGTLTEVRALGRPDRVPVSSATTARASRLRAPATTRTRCPSQSNPRCGMTSGELEAPSPGKRIAAMSPSGHTIARWSNDDTVEIVADGKQVSLVHAGRAAWVELQADTVVVTMSVATEQFTPRFIGRFDQRNHANRHGHVEGSWHPSPNGGEVHLRISQSLDTRSGTSLARSVGVLRRRGD